jgi:eukaryotic translation initiation factor 2C
VLLIPTRNEDVYSNFKFLTDRLFVVQTICITEANMTRAQPAQYMANLKMAGNNHSAPGIDKWLKNTLVLGADCTHPGSGVLMGTPSIAAVVGSLEADGGRFCSNFQLQKPKQEVCVLPVPSRTLESATNSTRSSTT